MFLTHSFRYLSRIFNTTHYREKGHKKFSLFLSLLGHLLLLLQVALTLTLTVTYRILQGRDDQLQTPSVLLKVNASCVLWVSR